MFLTKKLRQDKKNLLPTDKEIQGFILALTSSDRIHSENDEKTIAFEGLIHVLKTQPPRIRSTLQPSQLFRVHISDWPLKKQQYLGVETIIDFLKLKTAFSRYRLTMAEYDQECSGNLDNQQFTEYFLKEIMPNIDSIKDMKDPLLTCYLNTIESMFFFFLDQKKTGKIRIADVLMCGFLENIYGLQENSDDYDNWFSAEKTHELIATFQMLDVDNTNSLSREAFSRLYDGSFTRSFVDRLFEVHVRDGEHMNYQEFVIFQIAHNHLVHPASIVYFFKVLDTNDDGFIGVFELRYFYKELRQAYNQYLSLDDAMPEFGDFSDQILDMAGMKSVDGKVSVQDLIGCKLGSDFILCIISHLEFYRYENRENENLDQNLEDDSMAIQPSQFAEDNNENEQFDEDENNNSHDINAKVRPNCFGPPIHF